MRNRQRVLSALFAAAFVCVLVFCAFSAAYGCGHECAGEGCPICLMVECGRGFLSIAGILILTQSGISVRCAAGSVNSCADAHFETGSTLVSRKIKLSD